MISPATAIAALSTAIFPIFSRLGGEQLKRGLRKSLIAISLLSTLFTIAMVVLAPLIVKIAYGDNYSTAINLLRLGSLVIIPSSIIAIYTNFFISKGKAKLTTKLLVVLTVAKLVLGYVLVSHFIKVSFFTATVGVVLTRVIIEYLHLGALAFFSRRPD